MKLRTTLEDSLRWLSCAGLAWAVVLTTGLPAGADSKHDDDDDHGRGTVCERSAAKMKQSCRFEVKEEFYATTAKCINIAEAGERLECLQSAREALREDRELCSDQREARDDVCELLDEDRFPEALLDSDNFVDDPDDSNPYFSLAPGHTYVARAGLPPDFEELIVVTVTDEVREIEGVNCRLVVDIVLERDDDELVAVEVTDDYYAQARNADVHYCGEVARNFEDGLLVDLDGSFQAGRDLAKSGILIKAQPETGDAHRQEYLLGEAEDVIRYVAGVGDETTPGADEGGEGPIPCGPIGCVKTEEFIPPEPDVGEFKYFRAGVGFVLGIALDREDGTITPSGERDEVLCTGPSLDVLSDPACGIDPADLPELKDQLCSLSMAFCDGD